ncbi:sigma-70 family RNA polymerase sigma factor [Nocardia vulneris]|uniref:sigma-70 family RNA polymerase sigma factor n=1 Tax=Nocardia vulneris TaxID=1141657 RepID=UPI0007C8446E|nr:sigma-70 family RNA polymerase sigma factor [Nocardia vulneris]
MVHVTPGDATVSAALDEATTAFEPHRHLIFAVSYNLLGSVAEAEDVVQETWLAWAAVRRADIVNVRAYLVRIGVNDALARLHRARRERETYPGLWLPEPLPTDVDGEVNAMQSEAISFAMMVVLESLTPLERAVFVLNEAFGYSYREIAEVIERSPDSVRQVGHRAQQHIRQRRGRYPADPEVRRAVTARFLVASQGGDLTALLELLAPDVAMWTDSGGFAKTARRVILGRDKVLRLRDGAAALLLDHLTPSLVHANGGPAILLSRDNTPFALVALDLNPDTHTIRGIYSVVSPIKLRTLARVAPRHPHWCTPSCHLAAMVKSTPAQAL